VPGPPAEVVHHPRDARRISGETKRLVTLADRLDERPSGR